MFSVCFKRPGIAVEKTAEELIVNQMMANPKVTAKYLIKATGLSRSGVEYRLNKLKDSGRIETIGPDKGGHWKITTH